VAKVEESLVVSNSEDSDDESFFIESS